jgi:hypothetical protein
MAAQTNSVCRSTGLRPSERAALTDIDQQPIALKRLEQISTDVRQDLDPAQIPGYKTPRPRAPRATVEEEEADI